MKVTKSEKTNCVFNLGLTSATGALLLTLAFSSSTALSAPIFVAPGTNVDVFKDVSSVLPGDFKSIAFDAADNFYIGERKTNQPDIIQFTQASGYTAFSTFTTHTTFTPGDTRVNGLAFDSSDVLWITENSRSGSANPDEGFLRGPVSTDARWATFRPTDVAYNSVDDKFYFGRRSRTDSTVADIVSIDPADLSPLTVTVNPMVAIELTGIKASGITIDSMGTIFFSNGPEVFRVDKTGPSPTDFTTTLLAEFDFRIDSLATDSADAIYALEGDPFLVGAGAEYVAYRITQVPSPAVIWLMGAGILGYARIVRRGRTSR